MNSILEQFRNFENYIFCTECNKEIEIRIENKQERQLKMCEDCQKKMDNIYGEN